MRSSKGNNDVNNFYDKDSLFLLNLSYTETASIPGLSVAGANTELIKFTPPADAEYLQYGKCKCIKTVPATPDGKPTPALITKTAIETADIPMMVIDSGSI
ncbi:MAG: phosphoribosyltransferase, partial [Thermoproteota archaeon]|nr:phosphoribosyltransferase [Thermoproteota archaeon]